jgi:hypothetical protein
MKKRIRNVFKINRGKNPIRKHDSNICHRYKMSIIIVLMELSMNDKRILYLL